MFLPLPPSPLSLSEKLTLDKADYSRLFSPQGWPSFRPCFTQFLLEAVCSVNWATAAYLVHKDAQVLEFIKEILLEADCSINWATSAYLVHKDG